MVQMALLLGLAFFGLDLRSVRVTRLVIVALFVSLFPGIAQAQPFDPAKTVYAVSNVRRQLWTFDRTNPQATATAVGFPTAGESAMTVALDPLTNHLFHRAGGASAPVGSGFVSCVDASSLADRGYYAEGGGYGFETHGPAGFEDPNGYGNGAITIDPIMRVLYSDGGPTESDDCAENSPNHDSDGQVFAYSLVRRNYGQLIAVIHDPEGAHWMTDGNHLTWDPTDRVLWSAPSEYADGIRPRTIGVGNVHARGAQQSPPAAFGDVVVTGLPTIAPASSIGVDPDGRRVYLIPWDPPTNFNPGDGPLTVAEHPEGWYVREYDMDTFEELRILDDRAPPISLDSNSHCGYNIDFKLFFDRVENFLYETNFTDERGMFYDVDAGTVSEAPVGAMQDVYGFDGSLPVEAYDFDHDDDGIPDTVEVGADDITVDPRGGDPGMLNDADPTNWTSPYLPDTDGGGVDDGVEDANHNGRVDGGETNPNDPTDEPGGDFDGDGVDNQHDNCRSIANSDQADDDDVEDGDDIGDACEGPDPDHDGVPDDLDNCDCLANPDRSDVCEEGDNDGDTVPDTTDNCPCAPNTDQADVNGIEDGDDVGDACEFDTDGDGRLDPLDNCPLVANELQEDTCDKNTVGDACDVDFDEDGWFDECDNCPLDYNPDQTDLDGNGMGYACEAPPDTGCCSSAPGLASRRELLGAFLGFAALGLLVVRRRSV